MALLNCNIIDTLAAASIFGMGFEKAFLLWFHSKSTQISDTIWHQGNLRELMSKKGNLFFMSYRC
jgi:hypothetical protein